MLPLWRRSRASSSSKVSNKSSRRVHHLSLESLEARDVPAVNIVSFSAPNTSANGDSSSTPLGSISDDGRYVVYVSDATNLVSGQVDVADTDDVFLYDRVNTTTRLISRAAGTTATAGNNTSYIPTISGDGNWVAFVSQATNLITGVSSYSNNPYNVFLYSVQSSTLELVTYQAGSTTSAASTGPTTGIATPSLSTDGRYLGFISDALDLITGQGTTGDPNGFSLDFPVGDAFLYDRTATAGSRLKLVSHIPGNVLTGANDPTSQVAVSGDGNKVVFTSYARNLGQSETLSFSTSPDIFLYDVASQAITLVTHDADDPNLGEASQSDQDLWPASISDDGRYVTFASRSNTLVNGTSDGTTSYDVFLYDAQTNTNILLSKNTSGAAVGGAYSLTTGDRPMVNGDGTHVVFTSSGSNIISGVTGTNVYRYSIANQTYNLVSHADGSPTTAVSGRTPTISDDGRYVAYVSTSTTATADVYRYDGSDNSVTLISTSTSGPASGGGNTVPSMSGGGQWIAWNSIATNLITNDNNGKQDVFIQGNPGATPPSGINLSTVEVPALPNFTVGQLTTIGGTPGGTFLYTLEPNVGNNNQFTIQGNLLITIAQFTLTTDPVITVRTTDQTTGLSTTQQFTLTLITQPTNLQLNQLTVPASANTTFSQFTFTGQTGRNYVSTLVNGLGNNALFTLNNGMLSTGSQFPLTGQSIYTVHINVQESVYPGLNTTQVFTLTLVTAPTGVTANATVVPALANTAVGQLTATHSDPNRVYTYTLTNGTGGDDNGLFTLSSSGALSTGSVAPTDTPLSILVTATDAVFPTLSVTQVLTFTLVTAPVPVLSNNITAAVANYTFGTLSVSSSNRDYTYTLVTSTNPSDPSDDDNGLFTLTTAGVFATGSTFPPDVPETYFVLVRTTDVGFPGLFTDTPLTVVTAAAPPPPALTVPTQLGTVEALPTPVGISAVPADGTSIVTVTISNVPANVTFSAGTNNGDGTWTFTSGQLPGLTMTIGDNGTFTLGVTATATFPSGGPSSSSSGTTQVTVANVPPVISVSAPSVFNPMDAVTITVGVTNIGSDGVTSLTVNWGDGTIETFSGPGSFTHQYGMVDSAYTISVTVTDEDGTYPAVSTRVDAEFGSVQQALSVDLYQMLLGITPSAGQIDALSSALAAGFPLQTVVSFFLNTDLYRINAINGLFQQYLGRAANPLDLAVNLPLFTSGGSLAVQANILGSVEFFLASGGTPESYVQALSTAVFGAPFDPVATTTFAASLLTGQTLTSLAQQFVLSPFGVAVHLAETYQAVVGSPIDPISLIAFAPVELNDPDVFLEFLLGSGLSTSRLASV